MKIPAAQKNVFVYAGPGASKFCVKETMVMMDDLGLGERMLVLREPSSLIEALSKQSEGILVMPGGRDKPYQEYLSGEGIACIKTFVSLGGSYLGICAGAYFASGRVLFEPGTDMEVDEERELGFFPGTAYGTLFSKAFEYNGEGGASAANLGVFGPGQLQLYYNGGCAFRGAENFENVEILARYEEVEGRPAAVIKTEFGHGTVVLSGVHWEVGAVGARGLGTPQQVVQALETWDQTRREFAAMLVTSL